jgi:isopenicillin-N epimerase
LVAINSELSNEFLLDPDIVFLNHGSFGACPRPVFDRYQELQRELERQPVEFLAPERRHGALLDAARGRLAAYVGTAADNLAFATNATVALQTALHSLPLEPGDEVLLGEAEYGGMLVFWERLAARRGLRLVKRPFAELAPGPRTRLVFCSHVEWTTGAVNDVAAACAAARAANVACVVDGAHAPGQLDLDLDALGADVYAGNCHKWLCAPKGSAFLYVTPELQNEIEPFVISWDWAPDAPFALRHRWQGTRDPAAQLAVPAAIDFQAEHDWPAVRERCHALLEQAAIPLEPATDDFVQMRGYLLPEGTDGAALKLRLYDEHRIEVPIVETRDGWVMRVSVQAYNDESDLEALARALGT